MLLTWTYFETQFPFFIMPLIPHCRQHPGRVPVVFIRCTHGCCLRDVCPAQGRGPGRHSWEAQSLTPQLCASTATQASCCSLTHSLLPLNVPFPWAFAQPKIVITKPVRYHHGLTVLTGSTLHKLFHLPFSSNLESFILEWSQFVDDKCWPVSGRASTFNLGLSGSSVLSTLLGRLISLYCKWSIFWKRI